MKHFELILAVIAFISAIICLFFNIFYYLDNDNILNLIMIILNLLMLFAIILIIIYLIINSIKEKEKYEKNN